MNAILYCGVLVYYPDLTTRMKGLHNSTGSMLGRAGKRPKCVQDAFNKYEARGFSLASDYYSFWDFDKGGVDVPGFAGHECGQWAYCPRTLRHAGRRDLAASILRIY
jgi:hypothetical protein